MVQLIPKPQRKIPSPEKIFLYFSIAIFFISFFYYFHLLFLTNTYQKKVKDFEERILTLKTPEIEKMESRILDLKEKISYFSELANNRFFASKFFPFLEKKVHPKIYFSKMEVNFENSEAILFGESEDFYSLQQQENIFLQEPKMSVSLENISLTKEGKVNFSFRINFEKSILK